MSLKNGTMYMMQLSTTICTARIRNRFQSETKNDLGGGPTDHASHTQRQFFSSISATPAMSTGMVSRHDTATRR